MRIWWRCRASLPAAIVVVASTLALARFGLEEMPAPRIFPGVAPLFILFPAFVAAALVSVVDRGHHLAEARAARPVGLMLVIGLHVVVAAVGGAWFLALRPTWGPLLAWQAIRSVVGYSGAALIAYRCVGGRIAAATPVLYALLVATFGREAGSVAWFPLLDAKRVDATCVVAALWVFGVAFTVTRRARIQQWEREAGDDA